MEIDSEREPSFQEMLSVLSTFHGEGRSPLELIELQTRFISNKMNQLGQSFRLKMAVLRKKLQLYHKDASQELTIAQSFLEQAQNNVQQSKRECNKKIEKLQRQKLQRQIQIHLYVDQQILSITQQNENIALDGMEQLRGRVSVLKEEIQKWRVERKQQTVQFRFKLEHKFRTSRQQRVSSLNQHHIHMKQLKQKISHLEKRITTKLDLFSTYRKKAEGQIINDIQKLISNLSH